MSLPLQPAEARGAARYQVVLGSSKHRCEPRTFFTPIPGELARVELQQACELGDFDTMVVRKRRGLFSAPEAGRVLRALVLDDHRSEHSHFLLIAADRRQLSLGLHLDLATAGRRDLGQVRRAVLDMVRLCGGTGREVRALDPGDRPQLVELELVIEGRRQLVAIQGPGAALHRIRRKQLRRLQSQVLLLRERPGFIVCRAAAEGVRVRQLRELADILHEARIRAVERELGGGPPALELRTLT